MKKLIFGICLLIMNLLSPINVHATTFINSKQVITDMVHAVQEKDWNSFVNVISNEQKIYYEKYFSDNTYENGIKQVKTMSLESLTYINDKTAQASWLTNEYSILENKETDIETYLVGLNCTVTNENQYFYNGLNYFTIVLAKEDNEMKIVQFNRPSEELITRIVIPKISTSDKNYNDEISAINVIESAEQGYLINADGKAIENGFKTFKLKNRNTENKATVLSNNYSEHPALSVYTNYSIPYSVKVLMNRTGDGSISPVAFMSYVKCTVPNEWYASWDSAALKVGIYCVKGVGLYHSIKPINASLGYDVTQNTQCYIPGTSDSNINTMAENLRNSFIVNSNNKVFFTEYGSGTSNSAGTSGSGRLLQYGSQYLASVKSYSALSILKYYYSYSDCSSGNVKIVTFS